ncbi:MAG: methyltransferase domain-containing protein [Myxococcota bacterium]
MKSDISLWERLCHIVRNLEWRTLRAALGTCPICGRSIFLRFRNDPLGVRCIRCGAAPFPLAVVAAIRDRFSDLSSCDVYEASSRGPLFEFLRSRAGHFACSEFFAGVPSGAIQNGVSCQDLQALSYPDERFDLCTNTEVLEHVSNDRRAFSELHRVLRPGGHLIFSVPLFDSDITLERAEVDAAAPGGLRFIEEAHYHDDRIQGPGSALVYRDYGLDILDRLRAAGFSSAEIFEWQDPGGLSAAARAVVAQKSASN